VSLADLSCDMSTFNSPEDATSQGRTTWLMRYEAWLRVLARCEIDSRFAGKFDASDAVQNTLLEAWKGWDQFRGSEEPQRRAWLRQILAFQLAHLARQYAGTQMRDVTREVALEQSLGESSRRLDNLLVAHDLSPSQQAMANERSLRLAAALELLPVDYRNVITLRHIENLSHEEVATRMQRNSGAVRMLWMRALAALRDAMCCVDDHSADPSPRTK
jgi:RNA polymerase sigma-70 factor, ECF subfamily